MPSSQAFLTIVQHNSNRSANETHYILSSKSQYLAMVGATQRVILLLHHHSSLICPEYSSQYLDSDQYVSAVVVSSSDANILLHIPMYSSLVGGW